MIFDSYVNKIPVFSLIITVRRQKIALVNESKSEGYFIMQNNKPNQQNNKNQSQNKNPNGSQNQQSNNQSNNNQQNKK